MERSTPTPVVQTTVTAFSNCRPQSGALNTSDYFTPYNEAALNSGDVDLGSGGVVLLPDQPSGSPHLHLLAQAGKEGSIYLIDRDRMGALQPD